MQDDMLNFGGGLFGFLVLILDIIVLMEILSSNREIVAKLGWAALVFFFPIGGACIYFIFADRHQRSMYASIP